MKKTLCSLLACLFGLGLAMSQNSFSLLKMRLDKDKAYHSLGENATLVLQNVEGLKLNDLLLVDKIDDTVRLASKDSTYSTSTSPYKNTRDSINKPAEKYKASIPADFYFGKKKISYAGITADGMVFFSENDTIRPHSDKWGSDRYGKNSLDKFADRGIYNYIYFSLMNLREPYTYMGVISDPEEGDIPALASDPNQDKTQPTPLFATAETKIGYETIGDTLYIAYEKIRMVSELVLANRQIVPHEQIVSWNYRINLQTGEVGLQTQGFFTNEEQDTTVINMRWGLVADEGEYGYTACLKDFDGGCTVVEGLQIQTMRMGKDPVTGSFEHPVENAVYQFAMPEPCAAVTDAEITWSEDVKVATNTINITENTVWTGGENALFVLSKHQTLSGENLPVDGVDYDTATYPLPVKLGDGQAMVVKMMPVVYEDDPRRSDISTYSDFSNLEASTDYYMHVFVYNTACINGPVYGNALPAKKITTSLGKAEAISLKDVTVNSLKVVLPQAAAEYKYVIGISKKPLATSSGKPYSALLRNGTVYTEGQECEYVEAGYLGQDLVLPYTIAKVGVVDSVEITGLETGVGYHVMVWMMKGEGNEVSYSGDYSESTARTLYTLPFNINFVGEEVSSLPIGWESTGEWQSLVDPIFSKEDTIHRFKPHFCVQYTTMTGGEIFSAYLDSANNYNTATRLINAHTISPWVEKGEAERIQSTFRVRFFQMTGEFISSVPYDINEGDSVIFYWQEKGSDTWNRLGLCNHESEYDRSGYADLVFPFFKPKNDFRYKIDYYHRVDSAVAYFAIYNMQASSLTFPEVTNLHTENLGLDSVTIAWDGQADEYRLLWKERAAEGEYDTVETTQTAYTLKNLKMNTSYAYRVYGVYGGENGIVSSERYFTTLDSTQIDPDTVVAPGFNPVPGMVAKGTEVTITCGTSGAEIYYTVDGSEPSVESILYERPLVIDTTVTIKAIAHKEGMVDSKVTTALYTVEVGNESGLAAQVRIYPNPTEGLFYLMVPQAASVEIFASNGSLVKVVKVSSGKTALRLENSGVYFVKVNAGGQTAIKKIIVK